MPTADSDWKGKYLKSLDQIERLQQLERARMDVMRRGLARVSVAAQGQDEHLDGRLEELRIALRSQREILDLEPLLVELENAVKALDTRRRKLSDTLAAQIDAQLGVYVTSDLDRGTRRKLMAFRKRHPGLSATRNGQMEFLRSFAGVVDNIIQYQRERISELRRPEQKGLWTRLLDRWLGEAPGGEATAVQETVSASGGASPAVPGPTTDASAVAVPEARPPMVVQGVASSRDVFAEEMNLAESPESQIDAVDVDADTRTRIRTVLAQLLTQIEVTPALRYRRDSLLATLEKPIDWPRLPELLAEVSELVNAIRAQGQQEIEGFLVSLYQRLQDIQDFLLTARTREAQSYVHQQQLADEVRNELASIRESVSSGTDLLRVRTDIEKVVARILTAMSEFQKIEAERHESLNAGMEHMAARMKTMEEEANDLRDMIETQRRDAQRDPLTELPNRTASDERLQAAINRARLKGKPLAVAVLDIDDFDGINDLLGHLRGDKVLKLVAREIRRKVRDEDFVGRHAGETFLLMAEDVGAMQMTGLVDVVRQAVMALPFNFNGQRIPVTVSAGLAMVVQGDTPERLYERAEQAMRRAKRNGRNRTEMAD